MPKEDKDGQLYEIVGDCMTTFMKTHTTVFPNALVSVTDFWRIPSWKRAMVFVFLTRFMYGMDGQKQWRNFSIKDYKLNFRLFKKWLQVEKDVMEASSNFKSLPATTKLARKRQGRGRRQVLKRQDSVSSEATDSPMKFQIDVNDSFSSDESDAPVVKVRKIIVISGSDSSNDSSDSEDSDDASDSGTNAE